MENIMRIPLDPENPIPLYQQIQNYLREQIISEQLLPGTRLPATRKLAQDLGVSRITVQNAYADLESEGLIGSREGSGTYVLTALSSSTAISENGETVWPRWQQNLGAGDIFEGETPPESPRHPDLISFTGVGDPHEFPIKDFYKSLQTVIRTAGLQALDYGDLEGGYPPLRATVAHILASQGIRANPENILITSGSQQGLALVCQLLLKPGDVILVEKPTYNLALDLFRALDLEIVGLDVDADGLPVENLEPIVQQVHPKLVYTIPNFQNPAGVCLSGPRRRGLIALAERYNMPIFEDDFVGDLRYEGRAQPAIKALDSGGRVIYGGTFSKMLMPGLRVGYLVAEGPVFARLAQSKMVTDLTTSPLLQYTLNEYVNVGWYQKHLRRSTRIYRQRREAMMAAIGQFLPAEVSFIRPQGGLFIWLRLPDKMSAVDLLPEALKAGVEFAPGTRFFPDPAEGTRYVRLNFASQTPERIEVGIRRLGATMNTLHH
jgi:GntR family transcriptional regulator / MocR family aminotransferase